MIKLLIAVALSALSVVSNAALNIYTQHQVVSMLDYGVNKGDDVRFKTGDYPYIGQIGLEYQFKKIGYTLSYIHRSNVDVSGDEYNYNGVAVGVSYRHCLAYCK